MITQETIRDIIETVLDQGRLTKKQVMECWGISDTAYGEVQNKVLQDKRIELGPKGTGGFAAKTTRSRNVPDEAAGDDLFLEQGWESAAVQRLVELLSLSQLEELVGQLRKPLRQIRYHESRIDRPSTKRELAVALVLQHGIDLFCSSEFRKVIAAACRVQPLKKWHPGKSAPIEFVKNTGFPQELSGIPSPETLERVLKFSFADSQAVWT